MATSSFRFVLYSIPPIQDNILSFVKEKLIENEGNVDAFSFLQQAEKIKKPPGQPSGERSFSFLRVQLEYISRLWSAWTFDDFKLYPLAFFQRFETFHLNGGKMDEHVSAAVALDEAVAFLRAEPLDFALHEKQSLLKIRYFARLAPHS
jgi:hypothetical protein